MLNVSCLIKNTSLQQDIHDLVEYLGYNLVSEGKDASLGTIFNIIRKSGIEVDLQTVGHIYNEVLPKDFRQFMSDSEVNDFVLKTYSDAVKRAALLEQPDTKNEQIGRDSPEVYVVNGILNMFTNSEVPGDTAQSEMKQMQNALWKGIQRKLNLPENQAPKTADQWKDIINRALGYEQLGIKDLSGQLNGIADLYNAMRDQLTQAMSDVQKQADPAAYDRLQEMVNHLESTTYSLLFSRGEAKRLLEEMMKEAGFGKQLKNGKTILDWNKLAGQSASIQDLRDNVQKVLEKNGYSPDVVDGVKNSLQDEFTELQARILEKAQKELQNKGNTATRNIDKKSDLRRLAELNNLGIFQSSHNRALYNLLGISDLQQQDLADLQQIAQAASNLFREVDKTYGTDIYATRQLQSLQRGIDSIIGRNINNKSVLLKILAGIKNFLDVYLTGLLAGPLTIMENLWSGVKEVFVPTLMGAGVNKQDTQLYWKMLSDVTARGQSFGEEVGSFAPRELYVNTLKWKWKGTTAKEKAESLLFAITLPARIGLLGFDSANKVLITNKTFKNAVYQALTQNGMSKEDAAKFMNKALYGKSFEDAKMQAKEMIERTNKDLPEKYKIPVTSASITTLANDLVKANLNANGALSNEVIEAAYKSSYHVAGYGLGHEANNAFSKGVKNLRNIYSREEAKLIKEKKWDDLVRHRLKSTFMNNMIIRFAGGATNWVYLRVQSGLGLGLATGFLGKWNKDIDFTDKKSVEQSIKDIQNARNKIGRALVGISTTILAYAVQYALVGGEDDKDKKKKLSDLKQQKLKLQKTRASEFDGGASEKSDQIGALDVEIHNMELATSAYSRIKGNYMESRLFRKLSPDLMLINYYIDTTPDKLTAATRYAESSLGVGGQFTTAGKLTDIKTLAYRKDYDAAYGIVGSMIGDKFGFPFWRAGKDWYKLGKWISGNEVTSDFKAPSEFTEGVFGGGMLEDIGVFSRDSKITILPGIGASTYDKFKTHGVERMSDLKKTPNWWEMTYTNEAGNDVYILNATVRAKAKEAQEKYEKEK